MDLQDINKIKISEGERPESFVEVVNFSSPRLKEVKEKILNSDMSVKEKLKDLAQKEFGNSRNKAIYSTALGYGASSALYYNQFEYNDSIKLYSDFLDKIFNFKPLMLANGRVAPAIILQAEDTMKIKDDRTIQTVVNSYYIFKDLRVVSKIPSWRDYLIVHFKKPDLPDVYVAPMDDKEMEIWQKGARDGWKKGINQSNRILISNMSKLERDYIGSIRFHILKDAKVIKVPVFSSSGSKIAMKNGVINIGQKEFKIEVLPEFNADSKGWKFLPRLDNLTYPHPSRDR